MRISVIIPALNEENDIGDAIGSVGGNSEIIVVDAGSTDSTISIAEGMGAKIIKTRPGRGLQIDTGARAASGDLFLFLHADTRLPHGWRNYVSDSLEQEDIVGGAFSLYIDSPKRVFRLVELFSNIRAKHLGLIYGDQAIFVRRNAFLSIPSLATLPLMEDIECVKRLRKTGRLVILPVSSVTSCRRWHGRSVLGITARNWLMLAEYMIGFSPDRLYRKYYNLK